MLKSLRPIPNKRDIMNLNVKVKEKLTGSISVGGGYSLR